MSCFFAMLIEIFFLDQPPVDESTFTDKRNGAANSMPSVEPLKQYPPQPQPRQFPRDDLMLQEKGGIWPHLQVKRKAGRGEYGAPFTGKRKSRERGNMAPFTERQGNEHTLNKSYHKGQYDAGYKKECAPPRKLLPNLMWSFP